MQSRFPRRDNKNSGNVFFADGEKNVEELKRLRSLGVSCGFLPSAKIGGGDVHVSAGTDYALTGLDNLLFANIGRCFACPMLLLIAPLALFHVRFVDALLLALLCLAGSKKAVGGF